MAETTAKPKRLMPDQANRLLLHAVPVPPIAHAYHHWDPEKRVLTYTYNNRRIISLQIPGDGPVSFRHGADGTLQGLPFFQQVYVMVGGGNVTATARFQLSYDAINLRPGRAGREQAIVGQVGRPLLPGVNGLYDVDQDLMISWFGHPWAWTDTRLTPDPSASLGTDADGNLIATMEVELGAKTWVLNIKPQYYRTHLRYQYHKPWERRPNPKALAGWCTWEAYRRNITEANIVAAADFLAEHLRPYGLEYIQIDDGYEELPFPKDLTKSIAENWLDTKPEFPSGHAGVAQKIRDRGFQAGVWNNACVPNDEWAAANPHHLLKDANGELLVGDWIKYVLDCTPEGIAEQFSPAYRGLRQAGYTYFKIDGIRHLLYDGLHEAVLRGLMTNDEAERRFRRFLEACREEMGPENYWLSSWGVLTQMVGLCDACRIAQDAKPEWSGMQMQIVESARWFFTQRILYTNDPDHVCIRAPLEWSRTVLSLVSLTGGLCMLSDPIESYDAARIRLAQQTLPPLTTMTAETGPLNANSAAFNWTKLHGFAFGHEKEKARGETPATVEEDAYNMAGRWETLDDDHPFSTLWAVHLDTAAGRWCVAGRFASLPLRASKLRIASLSLETGRPYLVFDFWQQKYLGQVTEALDVPALPLGHCQILALRPALDRPQLLSSSRHVSQDAVSVKLQAWADGELALKLTGVRGTRETYWLHVPAGFRLADLTATDLDAHAGPLQTAGGADGALPIVVAFPPGAGDVTEGTLIARFAGRDGPAS